MEDLRSKTLEELEEIARALSFAKFKAKEIFRFVHGLLKDDISSLTTLNLVERNSLKAKYHISAIKPKRVQKGKGAVKVGFELPDGSVVEAVSMEYEGERNTLCISSQVGCPVNCAFCATGKMGFKRNLSAGEILSQVYWFAQKQRVSNIVFMGMGEPFLNYDNVMKAAKILNHPLGQKISARKIVLSTVGIISGIKSLSEEKEQFRLAWSLVAPNDGLRKELIPLKKIDPIEEIVGAIRDYQKRTKRRVTIEYVVLGGVNDGEEQAKQLIKISEQLDCHVNLIPYNPSPSLPFKPGDIELLYNRLVNAKVNATVRNSLGGEIRAACGQLAND